MNTVEHGVLRLGVATKCIGDLSLPDNCGWNERLSDYFWEEGVESAQLGDILLVPTYRLEEVEEIIEPEKPGVPVEPYVGLSWEYEGRKYVVVEVALNYIQVAAQGHGTGWSVFQFFAMGSWNKVFSDLQGYPKDPSTPAVTRKVKKWVKIEHPEVPEE